MHQVDRNMTNVANDLLTHPQGLSRRPQVAQKSINEDLNSKACFQGFFSKLDATIMSE